MSAVTYLQSAATQVASAANDLNRQIRDLRVDFDTLRHQLERDIVHFQTDLHGLQAQESTVSEDSDRDDLKRKQQDLQRKIEDAKQQINAKQQETDKIMLYKQQLMNTVNQMSRDLYTQAAHPGAQ